MANLENLKRYVGEPNENDSIKDNEDSSIDNQQTESKKLILKLQ